MGFADVREALEGDEGLRLKAYPDPLTGAEPWTLGFGRAHGIHRGQRCTVEEARAWLEEDINTAIEECSKLWPQWRRMNDARQDVLVNMMFNMGPRKLAGFVNTLGAMKRGDYDAAADGMLASLWAKQVKGRAVRLAKQMRTGERDDGYERG